MLYCLPVITEADKYRATSFQVGSFALMTPLGRLILDLRDFTLYDLNIMFLLYVLLSLFFFYAGIILLVRGLEILEK